MRGGGTELEESSLAVLFAIQTAQEHTWPVTASCIFRFLPRILRDKWHSLYLSKVLLRNLERDGWVEIIPLEAGILHYRLTRKGQRVLR